MKRDRGLTLLELVAAMALFALVAVMGLQSLTATLRGSDRLGQVADQTAELSDALALLRGDMASVVPMFFYPPQAAPLAAVWQSDTEEVIALSLAGQPSLAPRATDHHRVEWRHDAEGRQLIRRHWPTLLPAAPGQRTPEMRVLEGVTGLTLRSYWTGTGWVDGHFPPASAITAAASATANQDMGAAATPAAAYFSPIPRAIEITIETDRWGPLPLVQVLQ